jgi:hypothetical protein
MSKYDKLGEYLKRQGRELIPMTFAEIERVVGTRLPKSQEHQAWWSNSTSNNVMTKVWLDAGYETEQVDMEGRKLVFRRVRDTAQGMAEEKREFVGPSPDKAPRRHPAFGALKGTFTIEPGYDVTKPAMDDAEIAEWEANLERQADMIEQGMKGRQK